MRRQLVGDAWAKGVAVPGQPVVPAGTCGTAATAIRDWREVRPGVRVQIRGRSTGGVSGRILCYDSGTGWNAIEWTDSRFDIYSVAFGGDRGALYTWWATRGGLEPAA